MTVRLASSPVDVAARIAGAHEHFTHSSLDRVRRNASTSTRNFYHPIASDSAVHGIACGIDRASSGSLGRYRDGRGIVEVESVRDGIVYYRRDGGELLRLAGRAFSARFRREDT